MSRWGPWACVLLLGLGCGRIELPWMRPGWVEQAAADPVYPRAIWYNHGGFVVADLDGDGLEDVAYPLLDPPAGTGMLGVAIVLRREMRVQAFADPSAAYAVRMGGRGSHEWTVTKGSPAVLTVWNGCHFSFNAASDSFSVSCP